MGHPSFHLLVPFQNLAVSLSNALIFNSVLCEGFFVIIITTVNICASLSEKHNTYSIILRTVEANIVYCSPYRILIMSGKVLLAVKESSAKFHF